MTAYRWVRQGELPAFKAGGRLRVRVEDFEDFVRERSVEVTLPSGGGGRTDWAVHVERLHQLLRTGHGPEASALVRKVIADGAPAGDAYLHLLTPALHRVGDDWSSGAVTVAEEHRATEIVKAIVARLGAAFRRRGAPVGTAVTLTPPGELHGIASAMLADFLRAGGFDVHHLGHDVPVEDLRRFLRAVPCDAVGVSVTRRDTDPALLAALVDAAGGGAGAPVVMGGQGIDAERAGVAGATHVADLPAAADRLAGLLGPPRGGGRTGR